MIPSISNRLMSTTAIVLVLFLAITGYVLDRAYRASVLSGVEEQLKLVVYAVMGAVEEDDGRLYVVGDLSEPRLAQPDSGLYAQLRDDLGQPLWTSPSTTAEVAFDGVPSEPGAFMFNETKARFLLSYTVIWEGIENERVTFLAAIDRQPANRSIAQFRGTLGVGFALSMVIFVFAQLAALRWGLRPLHAMAAEVEALENGEREKLSEVYPRELQGLAANLDRFVQHEQRSRSRYRHALEDLAHSLKTPLAVVRNSLLDARPDKDLMAEQLERMTTTVNHQLTRASAQGPVVVGKPVDLSRQVDRLLQALSKAYIDKGVQVNAELASEATARGDESDFLEMLGNLIENAFKYTNSRVDVAVVGADGHVLVRVEDDGQGIPDERRQEVLRRGRRLDEIQPGQGIGLAMVADLVELYDGQLQIDRSPLGGARVELRVPK